MMLSDKQITIINNFLYSFVLAMWTQTKFPLSVNFRKFLSVLIGSLPSLFCKDCNPLRSGSQGGPPGAGHLWPGCTPDPADYKGSLTVNLPAARTLVSIFNAVSSMFPRLLAFSIPNKFGFDRIPLKAIAERSLTYSLGVLNKQIYSLERHR